MTGPAWPDGSLRSPVSGAPLIAQGEQVLVAGDEAWPVIEGIPFLRANRIGMAREAVRLIRDGKLSAATALLLTDQDPFAPDPPPSTTQCEEIVTGEASLTFRTAMHALGFGRVADYFAHRWTDPTFLSGLSLLGQALPADDASVVFELACGAGHFLAALEHAGRPAIGADLVFAKLWLARHFVSPQARLVCFDAETAWPLDTGAAHTLFCHDAFYFLPDKPGIAARMKQLVGNRGTVAVGHAHNQAVGNHSSGNPLTIDGYAALFPDAQLFDDFELTRAFVDGRPPRPADATELTTVAALSLLWQGDDARRPLEISADGVGLEVSGRPLRLNPLYRQQPGGAVIVWPSTRYEDEYAGLASYPLSWAGPDMLDPNDARARDLLRRRIYVDLPPRW